MAGTAAAASFLRGLAKATAVLGLGASWRASLYTVDAGSARPTSSTSAPAPHFSSTSGTKDLQMVSLSSASLRPEFQPPTIFTSLGTDYDDKVLPSIGNEVLRPWSRRFNADQLLTERPASPPSSATPSSAAPASSTSSSTTSHHPLAYGAEFSSPSRRSRSPAGGERSRFLVARAEQERRAAIVRAEASPRPPASSPTPPRRGTGLIELRRIEAAKEIAADLSGPQRRLHPAGDHPTHAPRLNTTAR
ncbi:Prohibitin-3, mitochondrial [Ananas comosus]|uniref:Prohibitin n=1 Tax=Ananas comosus TaxID=4615 RepID=A0A199USD1_ANACO|nr:Prohibitin-3, mitochondrial [Ananas comosus]